MDWDRVGLTYISNCSVVYNGLTYTAEKRIGFISYWLIKLIHGEKRLQAMSATTYLMNEMNKEPQA